MDKKSMEKNQRKKINGIERLPSLRGRWPRPEVNSGRKRKSPRPPPGAQRHSWNTKERTQGSAPLLEDKRNRTLPGPSAAAGRQKKDPLPGPEAPVGSPLGIDVCLPPGSKTVAAQLRGPTGPARGKPGGKRARALLPEPLGPRSGAPPRIPVNPSLPSHPKPGARATPSTPFPNPSRSLLFPAHFPAKLPIGT